MQQNTPLISIIITTFNRPEKIISAINSVINQTFQNFELIIINDGSTINYDKVELYCEKYGDKIKYLKKKNEERSIARNFAISLAKGAWVCFLDDDDIYYKNHLQVFYERLKTEKRTNVLYHTLSVHRFPDGTIKKQSLANQNYQGTAKILNDQFAINTICVPTKLLQENKFNPQLNYGEDYELWLRLAEVVTFIPINVYTNEYIHHTESTTAYSFLSLSSKIKTLIYLKKVYPHLFSKKELNKKIGNLAIGAAAFKSKNQFYYIKLVLTITPKKIFSRQFWGLAKKIL
ncbi:glycosyltransferase family 2 protein [Marinilabilia salmonicolor]|uniref:glycosyltransferase family 2 protein n=1 Tax=Marinilabilia salmonicolor TaxID=989 RepID=UPI00029B35A2|nr:glycosyltransferase family 2 protein [Marinilabilia salmonicolor]